MTFRQHCYAALAIALAVQIAMVVAFGSYTDWCFCAINRAPQPIPPPFVRRFLELAILPGPLRGKGMPIQELFVVGVAAWFVAVLALLHGMALAARVRIRAAGGADRRRIWLTGAESVRPWQMLSIGCVLIALGMAGGAMVRQRWLAKAERVLAATMAAASTGRPLPPHVEFVMIGRRGKEYVPVYPVPGFAIKADPGKSGDHFLDRFVAPYEYGGRVRLPSGERYEFTVRHGTIGWPAEKDGWSVDLYEENLFRR